MLFLGTKPYPQEDSFESFLSSNGGSSNAFTDSLDTVYYFDLNADGDAKFAEALQRFGAFFSEPLFTEAGTLEKSSLEPVLRKPHLVLSLYHLTMQRRVEN
jgi:insulysin